MNITESQIRSIVRQMLIEAGSVPVSDDEDVKAKPAPVAARPVFDVDSPRVLDDEQKRQADKRVRVMWPKIWPVFHDISKSDKVVKSSNATTDQSIAMNTYLQWYALAKGIEGTAPWDTLGIGTSWPAEALRQFQLEQGILADGRLGKQTATYIITGGKMLVPPPGMKLEDTSRYAQAIFSLNQLFANFEKRMGKENVSAKTPQMMYRTRKQVHTPPSKTPYDKAVKPLDTRKK
jgi:hypothetical protein